MCEGGFYMGNISDELSFTGRHREKFKQDLISFYSKMPFTHALTLSWNADVRPRPASSKLGIERARRDVGALLARVDRRLLGTRFHKKPVQRTTGVFFVEHPESNLHAHALI